MVAADRLRALREGKRCRVYERFLGRVGGRDRKLLMSLAQELR